MTAACAKCRAPVTARQALAAATAAPIPASEQHAGYEVFYAPEVSGWRYRAADSAASELSYRSAFLARKAIDSLGDQPPAKPAAKSKRAKK
jgi:hypothetical protein